MQLPVGLIIKYETKIQITKWTDGGWLQVVWNRKSRALLRKQGMLVLYAFNSHLTLTSIQWFMQWILTRDDHNYILVRKLLWGSSERLHSKQLLIGDHVLKLLEQKKKPSVNLLCLWIKTMAVDLSKSDRNGWKAEWRKSLEMLAVNTTLVKEDENCEHTEDVRAERNGD